MLRAIEVERVMGYIRKARDEKDRFFRAIEELNRAGAPDQVFLAVLESARQLAGARLLRGDAGERSRTASACTASRA